MQDCINIYNGGVLSEAIGQVIDAMWSDRITGELTLSFTSTVDRVPEITPETSIEFRGQYFRAVQVRAETADGAFLLSVSCEQEAVTLVDDEVPLFDFEGSPSAALGSLLSGTGITGTAEYAGTIRIKEENTNRRAVLLVIAGMCGGELEYGGHAVKIVRHRGRTEVRNLTEIVRFADLSRSADLQAGTESYEVVGWKPGDLTVGDEVLVDYEPLGIHAQRRIVGISHNPFNCTSVRIEVGDFVPDILESYRDVIEESADAASKAEDAAGKIDEINRDLGEVVKKSELSASIDTYINEETGKASIVAALRGTYAETSELSAYAKKTELSAEIGAYIDTASGTAKIVNNLKGTFVQTNELGEVVKKTELSAEIGAYIDTAEGTGKIVNNLKGTFAQTNELGSYVKKSELNAEIGAYIDTEKGVGKIVSAISGTYVTQVDLTRTLQNYAGKSDIPSLTGYLLKSELDAGVRTYLNTTSGQAQVVTAVSGTYVSQSNLSSTLGNYVTKTGLASEIGSYIDTASGKAKIVSAVSGTYVKQSDLTGYATASALSKVEQSVSDVKADITLSTSYTNNTIGTNVQALLQLVSNPNSSSIMVKADKINFTGFTTFVKASDLGANGTTSIDGGRILTGKISADRIDTSSITLNTVYGKGTYIDYVAMTTSGKIIYIGGDIGEYPSYESVGIKASKTISMGSYYSSQNIIIDVSAKLLRSGSDGTYSLGNASYAWGAVYTKKLYVDGKEVTGSSSAAEIDRITANSSAKPYVQLTSATALVGSKTGFTLGTSSVPFGTLFVGSGVSYYWKIDVSGIVPSSNSSSYFTIGSSLYPVQKLYAKEIYLNGTKLTAESGSDTAGYAGKTLKMGGSTTYYIQATTGNQLCPNTSSTYNAFYLGTPSYYWHYAYIGSVAAAIGTSSARIGFFGTTPTARQSVSSSATVATLISALKKYGLIY